MAEMLTADERLALHTCEAAIQRSGFYYGKPKTMARLAERGLVKALKTNSWSRIGRNDISHSLTEAGRAALEGDVDDN